MIYSTEEIKQSFTLWESMINELRKIVSIKSV